ncbi:MAG: IS4 family transposase [Planctomycetota bacterium]|nr:IS4 family transposase [Planctomycetota bacterium]
MCWASWLTRSWESVPRECRWASCIRSSGRDPDAERTSSKRHQRPFADKESFRWLESLRVVHERIPADTTVINVTDREGDIYEVFAEPRPPNSELLIRACYNRRLCEQAQQLYEVLDAQPVAGDMNVRLQQRPDRKPKDACLQVRHCTVTLRPPSHRVEQVTLAPVTLTAILVTDRCPPEGRKPIRWLLLTTLAVESLDDARRIVTYYTRRWLIERFHYTLKSGCRIEQSQLRTVARLGRLLALYCVVAWRLLWMLYLSRAEPDCLCSIALTHQEWRLLYLAWQHLHHRDDPLPTTPPPLREVVRRIAQLGGFIGRKGDGDPGVKTLWRGLMRLQDIVLGATIASQDVCNA